MLTLGGIDLERGLSAKEVVHEMLHDFGFHHVADWDSARIGKAKPKFKVLSEFC